MAAQSPGLPLLTTAAVVAAVLTTFRAAEACAAPIFMYATIQSLACLLLAVGGAVPPLGPSVRACRGPCSCGCVRCKRERDVWTGWRLQAPRMPPMEEPSCCELQVSSS
eukprot:2472953-Pleurochrysis_carterae.AAC.3